MILLNLTEQANLNPKRSASTQGGEWKSSCPVCGGTDRFIIQPNKQQNKCTGFYFCRRCQISGDTIQFAMDHLNYTFTEATELIGVTIETTLKHAIFKTPYKSTLKPLTLRSSEWHKHAAQFVNLAHQNLLQKAKILAYLAARGLSLNAVIQYQLGWSDQTQFLLRSDWGLSEKLKEDGTPKKLFLSQGLVIPIIESGKVIRLKIRRTDWHDQDILPKYVAVSGSAEGLNIIGNKKSTVMVIVESELDAYALHHAVGDFAVMIAVGGSTKDPDAVTNQLAQKNTLLICPDSDSGGEALWNKWKVLYPHAIKCDTPMGKDIGEAVTQGLDLRSWIISKLPEQIQYELKLIEYSWNEQDQPLIDWALDYINSKTTTSNCYAKIKNEIELGPKSQQAQTRELQNKLLLMKELSKR